MKTVSLAGMVVALLLAGCSKPVALDSVCPMRVARVETTADDYRVVLVQYAACRADGYLVTISSEENDGVRVTTQRAVAAGHSERGTWHVILNMHSAGASMRRIKSAYVQSMRLDGGDARLDLAPSKGEEF